MITIYRLPKLLIAFLVSSLATGLLAQSPDPASPTKSEIQQGICAFKAKNYALAQSDFEKALRSDPSNKLLPLFIARAVFFQYKPDVPTADNLAKGRDAIAAYSKILIEDPDNREAVDTIADLYWKTELGRLKEIAADETLNKAVRAEILIKLASKSHTCANDVTYKNRTEIKKDGKTIYRYNMPSNTADFNKAQNCAQEGIKFVEKALELSPNDEAAWSYKASLLIDLTRLAEMQQNQDEKTIFEKKAEDAKSVFLKISSEKSDKQRQADEEEDRRWKTQQKTPDEGVSELADFAATGKLRKEPRIDKNAVEPPFATLVAPVPEDNKSEQKVSLPIKLPWRTFVSSEAGFSALMPSPIELGGKQNRYYGVTSEGISYAVTYMDIPPAAPVGMEPMMAGMAWGIADTVCNFSLMAKATCEVGFDRKFLLGLYPGMQYKVKETDCSKAYPGLIRVYATPKHLYAVVITGADEHDPRVTKFLNSITLK